MKHFILAFLLLSVISVTAQPNRLPLYLRGDFGFSNVKTSNGKGKISFASALGLETFIKLKSLKEANISLSPNLSYLHTGYKPSSGGDVKVNYLFLGLPIGINISDDPKEDAGIFFGVGPFVSVVTGGKFRSYSIDDYTKMKFGNTTADNRRTADAGVVLKSALRYKKCYLGMQANIGTSNLVPKDRIENGSYIKSRSFLFYLSYQIK